MLVEAYLDQARSHAVADTGALLIVDADHFKSINDRLGHDCGDQALKLIATTIKDQLHGADIVGRIGGEEFAVFLPGADATRSFLVAESIRRRIREAEFAPDGRPCPLSVSIGGIAFSGPTTYASMFQIADRHLYKAKSNGRDQVSFESFNPRGGHPGDAVRVIH
jgi:diguanylate cyclase (GGDEF)-like protein